MYCTSISLSFFFSVLRGDISRLSRCTSIITGSEGQLPRCKPFKYTYEKEIVMLEFFFFFFPFLKMNLFFFRYAYFKKLDYFSTECIYSPNAYRGHARELIKDLEAIRPSSIIDIIHSGENFLVKQETKEKMPEQGLYCLLISFYFCF